MEVVGTLFIKNNKLLLNKPRKRPTYQLVAGKIETGETPFEAMIREAHEELGLNAIFDENCFEQILEFDEIASSDNITKIHYYLFKYNGELKGTTSISDEIEDYIWFDSSIKNIKLSNTLNHVVIPYCLENNLIK